MSRTRASDVVDPLLKDLFQTWELEQKKQETIALTVQFRKLFTGNNGKFERQENTGQLIVKTSVEDVDLLLFAGKMKLFYNDSVLTPVGQTVNLPVNKIEKNGEKTEVELKINVKDVKGLLSPLEDKEERWGYTTQPLELLVHVLPIPYSPFGTMAKAGLSLRLISLSNKV